MSHRTLYMLNILTRLIASTVIMPAILVGGMLTFPTTCQCGADHPHQHSIFEMPGHHHGDQRTTTGEPDVEFNRAGTDGMTVQTPSGTGVPTLAVINTTMSDMHALPRAAAAFGNMLIPDGLPSVPEVPPPQA